jgi:hypothetical protein
MSMDILLKDSFYLENYNKSEILKKTPLLTREGLGVGKKTKISKQ